MKGLKVFLFSIAIIVNLVIKNGLVESGLVVGVTKLGDCEAKLDGGKIVDIRSLSNL
jgi:hypothetical protein